MSAFLCSPHHINAIVTFASELQIRYPDWKGERKEIRGNEQAVATLLHRANEDAVNSRYGEGNNTAIVFKRTAMYRPIEIIKACNCFDYQACEVADYELTVAARITQAIMSAACRQLPGYDAAPWELMPTKKGRASKPPQMTVEQHIEMTLSNDEASSDIELIEFFVKEHGLSVSAAKAWVARRSEFLCHS